MLKSSIVLIVRNKLLSMSFNISSLSLLPTDPGVYLMKDHSGIILYIGKAKNIKKRVAQYFIPGRDGRPMLPYLTSKISSIDTIVTFSEKEALLLENSLIKKHQPKYNILLKDDKTFISLMINHEHSYPMIRIVRSHVKPKQKGLFFGPYPSAFAARQTLEIMQKTFPLRQCSDHELLSRSRPCLLYSIKRCLAPCVQKCTKGEYGLVVKRAIAFLKGHDSEVIQELEEEMEKASQELAFEKAGVLLQTIKQIKEICQQRQSITHTKGKDCDLFYMHQRGTDYLILQLILREGNMIGKESYLFTEIASSEEEIWESFLLQHYRKHPDLPPEVLLPLPLKKKKLLEEILFEEIKKKTTFAIPKRGEKSLLMKLAKKNAETHFSHREEEKEKKEEMLLDLQEKCHLNRCPVQIDCFDTSNLSGTDLVACMVSFRDGMRDRKRTRLFRVKHVDKGDDYGALREVLRRHYLKAKEEDLLPDLTIIDGGKGQLHVALEVFKELEIASVDLISLAKEEGKHDKGLRAEKIFLPHQKDPVFLPPRSSTLFTLQKIRDEAHRVALSFHRKRREKRLIQSKLDQIPGIGPKKRILLLKHFGSFKEIEKATKEELSRVKGLSKKDIETLYTISEK